MSARAHISLKVKLAAALLQLRDDAGALLIPYEHAKLMTADQVCSLFAFDHYPIRHADDGPSEPWNLVPRMIPAHREKTAKVDAPAMARDRDIAGAHELFRRRLLAKDTGASRPQPSRWPKGRKLRSRGFDRRRP